MTLRSDFRSTCLKVAVHLSCLLCLCLYFFQQNEGALYFGYDGAYMRQLFKFHFEWSSFTINLILNPLQGLSDFTFPINYWLSPASIVSYLLYGADPNPIVVYTITTAEIFASTWLLGRALGASVDVRITASWLAAVLTMPFLVPPHSRLLSFYAISGLIPWIIEHVALSSVILVMVLGMFSARTNLEKFLATLGFLVCTIWSVAAFTYSVLLDGPLVFLFFCFFLSRRSKIIEKKDILGFSVIAFGLAAPFLFVVSLTIQSVPSFFNSELIYGRPGLIFISILFHGPLKIGWGSSAMFVAGLCGALFAIRFAPGRFSLVAKFYLAYSLLLIAVGLLTTFVFVGYRGPSMLYFEWFIWPFIFIYASYFFAWAIKCTLRKLPPDKWPLSSELKWWLSAIPRTVLFPVVAAGAILAISKPSTMAAAVAPFKRPPGTTSIVGDLQKEIGLIPGSGWRGSVATFNGIEPADKGTSWADNSAYDLSLWQSKGNDQRSFGLWWYGIPTLFAYNQFLPPDYYFVMTRLFATPKDIQQRSVVVLTQPDAKLLSLFGVRFVIADAPIQNQTQFTLRRSFDWQTSPHKAQFLYEIPNPNLGNFSPTRQVVEPTAAGGIAKMKQDDFHPDKEVILQAAVPVQLSKVISSSLQWGKAGLHVIAKSDGDSLLVLPLQYSSCLQIHRNKQSGGEGVELVRTDIMLTGIRFSKEIDATVALHFGPFDSVLCRTTDFLEFRRMMNPS